eukprot:991592-Alexandrium_andersonii.AAC.1
MLRLEGKTPGREAWKDLRSEIAEAICQHVNDRRWRTAFLAVEGIGVRPSWLWRASRTGRRPSRLSRP